MRKQQGYTLIELMIALALGLIIVAAVVLLLLGCLRALVWRRGYVHGKLGRCMLTAVA